jgi:hypothetical protein
MSDRDLDLDNAFPGIDRLYYFLVRIAMVLLMVAVVMFLGFDRRLFEYASLLLSIGTTILDVMRLRNMGVSQWFVFLRFIPYFGLLFSIGLQSAPTGWAERKRLDRAGIAILAAHIVIIGLVIYFLSQTNIEVFGIAF